MSKFSLEYNDKVYEIEEGAKGLWYSNEGFVFKKTKKAFVIYAEPKYLEYRGQKFKVIKHKDGLWRFEDGTIADIEEDSLSADKVVRCGVGYFSLSPDSKLTDACRPHDHAYSAPAYQALHDRSEADAYLESLVKKVEPGLDGAIIGRIFRSLSSFFGASKWENEQTRNK